jgi:hypothetical protein
MSEAPPFDPNNDDAWTINGISVPLFQIESRFGRRHQRNREADRVALGRLAHGYGQVRASGKPVVRRIPPIMREGEDLWRPHLTFPKYDQPGYTRLVVATREEWDDLSGQTRRRILAEREPHLDAAAFGAAATELATRPDTVGRIWRVVYASPSILMMLGCHVEFGVTAYHNELHGTCFDGEAFLARQSGDNLESAGVRSGPLGTPTLTQIDLRTWRFGSDYALREAVVAAHHITPGAEG